VGSRILEDPDPTQILGEVNNILTILGMDRGFIPLLEEGNVRGVADSGCISGYRPGYKRDRTMGKDYLRMLSGIRRGDLQALLINEASIPPEQLRGVKFLVLTEVYPSDLDSMADVILPTAAFSEENGHFTSFDGREYELRKAVDPPGMSMPEWQILNGLAREFGYEKMEFNSPQEIREEMEKEVDFFGAGKRPPVPERKELIPVMEPGELHLTEHPLYVVRYRGTPIHEMVDDLKVYLEENERIPIEDDEGDIRGVE
jgi:predicted molibdopterin-dependent oxidoreductase YjgC